VDEFDINWYECALRRSAGVDVKLPKLTKPEAGRQSMRGGRFVRKQKFGATAAGTERGTNSEDLPSMCQLRLRRRSAQLRGIRDLGNK